MYHTRAARSIKTPEKPGKHLIAGYPGIIDDFLDGSYWMKCRPQHRDDGDGGWTKLHAAVLFDQRLSSTDVRVYAALRGTAGASRNNVFLSHVDAYKNSFGLDRATVKRALKNLHRFRLIVVDFKKPEQKNFFSCAIAPITSVYEEQANLAFAKEGHICAEGAHYDPSERSEALKDSQESYERCAARYVPKNDVDAAWIEALRFEDAEERWAAQALEQYPDPNYEPLDIEGQMTQRAKHLARMTGPWGKNIVDPYHYSQELCRHCKAKVPDSTVACETKIDRSFGEVSACCRVENDRLKSDLDDKFASEKRGADDKFVIGENFALARALNAQNDLDAAELLESEILDLPVLPARTHHALSLEKRLNDKEEKKTAEVGVATPQPVGCRRPADETKTTEATKGTKAIADEVRGDDRGLEVVLENCALITHSQQEEDEMIPGGWSDEVEWQDEVNRLKRKSGEVTKPVAKETPVVASKTGSLFGAPAVSPKKAVRDDLSIRPVPPETADAALRLFTAEIKARFGENTPVQQKTIAKERGQYRTLLTITTPEVIVDMIRILVWDWDAVRNVFPGKSVLRIPTFAQLFTQRDKLFTSVGHGFTDDVHRCSAYYSRFIEGPAKAKERDQRIAQLREEAQAGSKKAQIGLFGQLYPVQRPIAKDKADFMNLLADGYYESFDDYKDYIRSMPIEPGSRRERAGEWLYFATLLSR